MTQTKVVHCHFINMTADYLVIPKRTSIGVEDLPSKVTPLIETTTKQERTEKTCGNSKLFEWVYYQISEGSDSSR